ncbi:MAG TPA: Fe-S-binding domain-containing protein, partial [Ignavibacteriaceae bacterium]
MEQNLLLTYLILIPLIGSFLILFIRKEHANFIRYTALGISTIAFIISLIIYFQFDSANSDFQF